MNKDYLDEILNMIKNGTHRNTIINHLEKTIEDDRVKTVEDKRIALLDSIPTYLNMDCGLTMHEIDELADKGDILLYTYKVANLYIPVAYCKKNIEFNHALLDFFNKDHNKVVQFLHAPFSADYREVEGFIYPNVDFLINNKQVTVDQVLEFAKLYSHNDLVVEYSKDCALMI